MRVFITGVAGFLGSHLADALLAQGHEVSGCDNMLGGSMENVPKDVRFHLADCRYLDRMREAMQGMEVLYHCAATPHEGLSVFSPSLIADHILNASATTFSAAVSCGIQKVIYCSSMARYGRGQPPFDEQDDPDPVDPYGVCKVAAEQILRSLSVAHGFEYAIAVPHNIIGPRQKYDDPYRNVAAIMINRLLQLKRPIIYGDGSQKRCFSDVQDAVACLVAMLHLDKRDLVINIGPDEQTVTILELCVLIQSHMGIKIAPMFLPPRPMEVEHATCSSALARAYLGYKTTRSLDQSIFSLIDDIRARGSKPFKYHLPVEIVTEKTPKTWTERIF